MIDSSCFLDREPELRDFASLLSRQQERILLLYGEKGMGKSCLMRRLRAECDAAGVLSVVVDFGSDYALCEDPDSIITLLQDRLGGAFADGVQAAEAKAQQDFAASGVASTASEALASAVQAALASVLQAALPPANVAPASGLSVSGPLTVSGDMFGGHKISTDVTINNPQLITSPGGGLKYQQEKIAAARDGAFRPALKAFVAQQPLMLIFDHFEEAMKTVPAWLQNQVLGIHTEGEGGFSNLWLLVSGDRVPFQDRLADYTDRLCAQPVGPLPDDAIYLYWCDQRGLDRTYVATSLRASKHNTRLLFMFCRNILESEPSDGR
jgi:hypothetical protein